MESLRYQAKASGVRLTNTLKDMEKRASGMEDKVEVDS